MIDKRVALIIANDQYQDDDLSQLIAPAQDAEALAQVLQDPDIGGFEVQTLLNEPSYKVREEIDAFFDERQRGDLLLLYFSSHGVKDAEGRLYFATTNTHRKRLRSTGVSANFVNEVMRHSRSRRQVLLLDCCYSGAFARGMVVRADKEVGTGEYFKRGRGQVVLTASDALQYAFEGDEVKGEGVRSVFTHTLVQGLTSGQADLDGDGLISIDELYDYVYGQVTDRMPEQEPRKWVFDLQDKIIIARNPNPVVKQADLLPESRESIEDRRPWVRVGEPVTYRSRIRLVHMVTGHHLHSHSINYTHPGTSGQQQVTAHAQSDENDYWIVKGPDATPESYKIGHPVENGDVIRLEHEKTRKNLHSHSSHPSPIIGQQEVTAFGENGGGDFNDNWRVEVDGGGTWSTDKRVRFVHVETQYVLHSHSSQSHPKYTMGQQEVTCFEGRDINDWWCARLI